MRNQSVIIVVSCLVLNLSLTGCQELTTAFGPLTPPTGIMIKPRISPNPNAGIAVPDSVYPENKEDIGEPYNIVVLRSGRNIRFDNRTATPYKNVRVFLNMQYAAIIPEIPIGLSPEYDIESFVNIHAEPYPTARFLNPERNKVLLLADLIHQNKVHKLTVKLDEDWQRR